MQGGLVHYPSSKSIIFYGRILRGEYDLHSRAHCRSNLLVYFFFCFGIAYCIDLLGTFLQLIASVVVVIDHAKYVTVNQSSQMNKLL